MHRLFIFLGFLALLLTACGGDSTGGTAAISGTVMAPAGTDVTGTVVQACLLSQCENPATRTAAVQGAGPSGTFSIEGLQTGMSYTVYALQQSTGYRGGSNAVTAPAQNVLVTMSADGAPGQPTNPANPANPADPTSPTGNVSGSWTGTVTDQSGAASQLSLTLTQTGTKVTGELTLTSPLEGRTPIVGTLSGATITIGAQGILQFSGTIAGATMTGSGAVIWNGRSIPVTFTATKGGSPNPADPANPTSPANPADPTNPTSPANPADPASPTDPTDSADPSTPTEPSNPTNPSSPADPTNPSDPSTPTNPTDPTSPSDPSTPTNPTDPTNPSDPSTPTNPTAPSDPSTPTNPADPSTPTNPSDPSTPTNPTDPSTPTNPANPENPTDPTNPDPTNPESGKVVAVIRAPSGGSVLGTGVLQCSVGTTDCRLLGQIEVDGPSVTVTITSRDGNRFDLVAIKDVNQNGTFDAGDYFSTPVTVTVPANDIEIILQIYSGGAALGGVQFLKSVLE